MFDSTMDFSSQSQQNPNPSNPNFDWGPYAADQCDNISYFDIAEYLMFSEDEHSEKNILLENKNLSKNVTNYFEGSSSSVLLAHDGKRRRELKQYKEKDESRFAFRTKTDLEIMDDGYKWRKYGKKMVKNSPNPRNYFKCTSEGCHVKKRVERDGVDPSYVITTYQGMHNHETPNCVLYCSPHPSSLFFTSSSI